MLEVPDWGSASSSWFGYGHWPVTHPWSEFWLSILILKVQRTSMSFKPWLRALVGAEGSWLGFGILILILIRSLVFGSLIWFQRCKENHVLQVLICSFGGCWRFLSWVWHLYLDLGMVNILWYTHDPNFGSLSWFWRCKEYPCPFSPYLRLWRTQEVPDWGLAS